jgi:hypothetical protein
MSSESVLNVRSAFIVPGRATYCPKLGREVAIICAQYQLIKDKKVELEFIICEPFDCPHYKVEDRLGHKIGNGKCHIKEKEELCDLVKVIILNPCPLLLEIQVAEWLSPLKEGTEKKD